jgi:CheY-like chemotaxis protein
MLRLVELYLIDYPAELTKARNGRIALKYFEQSAFDLLLTDLQMPEVDGITLIKKLRNENKKLPIIVLSAFGMEKMTEDAVKLGANKVLSKPFDSNTLKQTIEEQLNDT